MTLSVADAIAARRATRRYTDEIPGPELLDRVVGLALEAPSAFNAQQRDLVVVRDPAVREALFDASRQRQFLEAPVIFITVARVENDPADLVDLLGAESAGRTRGFLLRRSPESAREAAIKDATLLAGFLMIAAQAEGLATSPTTGWDEELVKEAIGIGGRGDRAIALVIAAGFPAEAPEHPGRAGSRRIDDHYWGNP